ncbi:MAG: hypothetical protein ACRCWJ_09690 [Casimicrobium sp.]
MKKVAGSKSTQTADKANGEGQGGDGSGLCIIGTYGETTREGGEKKCPSGYDAHHIVADKTFGIGNREERRTGLMKDGSASRLDGMPTMKSGICVCLGGPKSNPNSEHAKAHLADAEVANLGKNSKPPGTAPVGEVAELYMQAAMNAVLPDRPGCAEQIRVKVQEMLKDIDKNTPVRTDTWIKGPAKDHLKTFCTKDNSAPTSIL